MTTKEAIKLLRRMQEPEAFDPQINEAAFNALDMAIKALVQPEIIYCKECKHYKTHIDCVGGEYNGCEAWTDNGNEMEVEPDDFCSYAERKTDA